MTKLSHSIGSLAKLLPAAIVLAFAAGTATADDKGQQQEKMKQQEAVKVDANSFKCITEMTAVRHFYVDNLRGDVAGTVAVAKAGRGDYPEGSVIQLVPTEAMVKQQKGFNPATRDWEFFALDVDKDGTKIYERGYQDVNNRFGLNCFTCHQAVQADFDFVCEQEHGCAPIPVTRAMFGALQRTDPRCKIQNPVTEEDKQALKELEQVVKALKTTVEPGNK